MGIYLTLRAFRHRAKVLVFATLTPLILLLASPDSKIAQPSERVYRVGSEKQLFIDNILIGNSKNVTLTMNPASKTGERTVVSEFPWEEVSVAAGTVIEDEGIFKMWYIAEAFERENGEDPNVNLENLDDEARHTYMYKHLKINLCYATSHDGIHWEKPKLGLIEFRGSKQNNIVLTDAYGTVFLDPKNTDGNRFKFTGRIDGGFALWVWTSPDGLHWKPFQNRPILRKGPFDTQNEIFWDDRIGKYVAYVRRGGNKENSTDFESIPYSEVFQLAAEGAADPAGQRKVGRAESMDLANWPNDPEIVFSYDPDDPVESDHYNPCVIKYPYSPNVYVMFPSAFLHSEKWMKGAAGTILHTKEGGFDAADIQLAVSRDGIHWNRHERRPYVRLGIDGSDDGGMIFMMIGMLRKGPELWMYYAGEAIRHGDFDVRTTRRLGVVSRVVQRLDGFISADAAYQGGELTTVPLIFDGGQLQLNVDTGALGSVRVELLDQQGRVIPGYAESDCDPINGNYIARTVTWKGKSDVSALAGQVLSLRFVMRSTKLYAFQFLPTAAGVR